MKNHPTYIITEKAADYLAKIVETITRLEYGTDFKKDIRLHRENRVKTIYSSLAIEGNALSLDEVTDVVEGKIIRGRQADIKEVKNAYDAYEEIMDFSPYEVKDFLKAHNLMTQGLVEESGRFRKGDVGVFDGDLAVHLGARPQFVPGLVEELFTWAKSSDLHPVLKSAILHYEIEIIHPFSDGNGRMGRLWQTLILAKWNEIFAWIPMETVLFENRDKYYFAISESKRENNSSFFLEFVLSAIYNTLSEQLKHQDKHQDKHKVHLSDIQLSIINFIKNKDLSRKEIFEIIGLKSDSRSFKRHMSPLIEEGLIKMTIADKPNSPLQKYSLTDEGREVLKIR